MFRGSLAGTYFNKDRVKNLKSGVELLNDYRKRKELSKNSALYLNFLRKNPKECLKVANEILSLRSGNKVRATPPVIKTVIRPNEWYTTQGYRVVNNPDGGFDVYLS